MNGSDLISAHGAGTLLFDEAGLTNNWSHSAYFFVAASASIYSPRICRPRRCASRHQSIEVRQGPPSEHYVLHSSVKCHAGIPN